MEWNLRNIFSPEYLALYCFFLGRAFVRALVITSLSVLLIGAKTSIAAPLDLIALRDSICAWETRNSKDPDAEVGSKGEFGRCQLRLGTARGLGYKGHPARLFDRDVNEYWALVKLVRCGQPLYRREWFPEEKKWKPTVLLRPGYTTVKGYAWCFNRGLWAGKSNPQDAYAVAVADLYAQAIGGR